MEALGPGDLCSVFGCGFDCGLGCGFVCGFGCGFVSCLGFSVGASGISKSSSESSTYSDDLNFPSGFGAGLRSVFLVTRPVNVLLVFLFFVGARLAVSFSPVRFFSVGADRGGSALAELGVRPPLLAFSVSCPVLYPSLVSSDG